MFKKKLFRSFICTFLTFLMVFTSVNVGTLRTKKVFAETIKEGSANYVKNSATELEGLKEEKEIKEDKNYKELVQVAVDKASDWMIKNFNKEDGHWQAIAICRAGKEVPKIYMELLNEGRTLPDNSQGQYGKFILGILAAGGNPENVAEHNLYKDMIKNVSYSSESFNMWGLPWDLAALNAIDYELPKDCGFTKEDLVKQILSKKVEDGGFSGFGNALDVDATGFAAVALYPYYQKDANVKSAMDSSVKKLSQVQNEDGGFKGSWGSGSNINSAAQALMAIALAGQDPTSGKFTKTEGNLIDYILGLQNEDGSFNWKKGDKGDIKMATEQTVYALDQYLYYLEGKGSIWEFDKKVVDEPEKPVKPVEEKFKVERIGEGNLKKDSSVEIKFDIENISKRDEEVTLAVILYDKKTNEMINYSYVKKILKSGKKEVFAAGFIIPEKGDYLVKAIICDDLNPQKMNVLVDPIKIEVE
ncbi:prenyltransferase/squalene oxidase repeat-containing protein [Clostridium cochlearium]|uniref:prenyltransferase/squalene oxidase repeat-containing protein n=1 Tax=Clostridium cochlearium TaxID=1494 RepID=UPI0022E355F8|nr:prenyltransferase/squalene oxidase repeat-containing protein [Clostridium cochlearium]